MHFFFVFLTLIFSTFAINCSAEVQSDYIIDSIKVEALDGTEVDEIPDGSFCLEAIASVSDDAESAKHLFFAVYAENKLINVKQADDSVIKNNKLIFSATIPELKDEVSLIETFIWDGDLKPLAEPGILSFKEKVAPITGISFEEQGMYIKMTLQPPADETGIESYEAIIYNKNNPAEAVHRSIPLEGKYAYYRLDYADIFTIGQEFNTVKVISNGGEGYEDAVWVEDISVVPSKKDINITEASIFPDGHVEVSSEGITEGYIGAIFTRNDGTVIDEDHYCPYNGEKISFGAVLDDWTDEDKKALENGEVYVSITGMDVTNMAQLDGIWKVEFERFRSADFILTVKSDSGISSDEIEDTLQVVVNKAKKQHTLDNSSQDTFLTLNLYGESAEVENPAIRVYGKNLYDAGKLTNNSSNQFNVYNDYIKVGIAVYGRRIFLNNGNMVLSPGTYTFSAMGEIFTLGAAGLSVQVVGVDTTLLPKQSADYKSQEGGTHVALTFTITQECEVKFSLQASGNSTQYTNIDARFWDIQLEVGTEVTEFEPYVKSQEVVLEGITLRGLQKDEVEYKDEVVVDGENKSVKLLQWIKYEEGADSALYDTPLETDITDTEAGQALLALHTNNANTIIFSDAECSFSYTGDLTSAINDLITKYQEGIGGGITTVEPLPDYWKTHLNEKMQSIQSNSEDCKLHGDSFIFFTDYHIESNSGYSHLLMKEIIENTTINKVIFGGDVFNYATTIPNAWDKMLNFAKRFFNFELYCVRGNHEYNLNTPDKSEAVQLNDSQMYSYLIKRVEDKIVTMPNSLLYYQDNVNQKIRYIFLDTKSEDSKNHPITDEELQWFKDRMTELDNEWSVVVFAHQGLHGSWGTGYTNQSKKFIDAISEVKDTMPATFIALISGHDHLDNDNYAPIYDFEYDTGFLIISVTCDAKAEDPLSGYSHTKGTINEHAFDVFSIDTANRKIKATRIGRGVDREWNY